MATKPKTKTAKRRKVGKVMGEHQQLGPEGQKPQAGGGHCDERVRPVAKA
jgi:hypothetical protein